MSTPKKVLFIGLAILALGIVILTLGVLQSPVLWQTFQCGYDLSLNNSSLTRDQISKYCNNRIQETDINLESSGLITVGFGIIFSYRLDNNCNRWWHMAYTKKKKNNHKERKKRSIISRSEHRNEE